MEMPCLMQEIIQKFLSQTSTGLRAQCCCSSSHSSVPWLSAAARLALSRSGFSGHQWQKSLSSFRESVLSLSCATLLVMYSPMCHTLCLTLCCQTIFHNPAALALCVWLYHPAKESPFSSLYLGRCVCVTKQRRPLSLDPRSFCFP